MHSHFVQFKDSTPRTASEPVVDIRVYEYPCPSNPLILPRGVQAEGVTLSMCAREALTALHVMLSDTSPTLRNSVSMDRMRGNADACVRVTMPSDENDAVTRARAAFTQARAKAVAQRSADDALAQIFRTRATLALAAGRGWLFPASVKEAVALIGRDTI